MIFLGFTNPVRAFNQFFLTGHYLLYLICILFLQMNFDSNEAPLQQLVDYSDAFSSNEVILIL